MDEIFYGKFPIIKFCNLFKCWQITIKCTHIVSSQKAVCIKKITPSLKAKEGFFVVRVAPVFEPIVAADWLLLEGLRGSLYSRQWV